MVRSNKNYVILRLILVLELEEKMKYMNYQHRPFLFIVLCTILCHQSIQAQEVTKGSATPTEYEKNYQKRIKKEVLYDVYIPEDLNDALDELERLTDQGGILKFKEAPEDSVAVRLQWGLGRWIIHNWGFYEGSRLSHHLKLKGITDPNDMAKFLIVSWHRKLNGLPINEEAQIKVYQERLLKQKLEREKQREVISVEKKIRKN